MTDDRSGDPADRSRPGEHDDRPHQGDQNDRSRREVDDGEVAVTAGDDRSTRNAEDSSRTGDGTDGAGDESTARRTAGHGAAGTTTRRPGTGADGPGERASEDTRLRMRSLRTAISVVAVFGYVLTFGAAVAAVAHLLGHARWIVGIGTDLALRVGGAGALLLPAAAFLFVALYDDADLIRPAWSDGHPPLVDAWLLATGTAGLVAVALSRPDGTSQLWELGWLAAGAVAYLGVPFWLGRRCLRRPSWLLGGLAMLLAITVPVGAVFATITLPIEEPLIGAVAAVVGTAVPYGLAASSPGPERLARRAADALNWLGDRLRSGLGRLPGRG